MPAKNITAKSSILPSRGGRAGPPQSSQAASSSHAGADPSGVGIRRRDLDRDLHDEMVRRGPDPRTLQRNRLARLVRDCDTHEVLIPDHATRRIEVDPARAGKIDLDPGMGVATGDTVVVVIGKMKISGHEPSGDPKRSQRRDHEHCKVATTPARELQGPDRVLDSLLMPRHMLEGPLDGLRHVDKK